MNPASRAGFGIAAMLCACHLLPASLAAQAAPTDTAATLTNASPSPPKPMPPLSSRTGISFFRELLAMNSVERTQALTNYSPASRTQILAKVREYESLPPDDRELRLRVTELHSYLQSLMGTSDTNRAPQLARIPEADRKLVEDRLREWDKLAPEVQTELLEHEATLSYLSQIEGRTEEQRRIILTNIPPASREMLERGINKWNSMSDDQRRKTLDRFSRFFELTAPEKEKALKTLSEAERRQIEKTLRSFGNLRPDKRAESLRSFEKFTSLSLAERLQFFKDVERWQQLSPSEREAWRELVRRVPPPPPRPRPPLPPVPPRPEPTPAVATNGN